MKQVFSLSMLCLLLAAALPAYADIARPNPTPSPQQPRIILHTRLTIAPDNKAREARLQISQSSLQELRAALANAPANESMVRASLTTLRARCWQEYSCFCRWRLPVSGWRALCRRGARRQSPLSLGTAVIGAATIIAHANAGPPGSYFWRKLPQNLSKGTSTLVASI